MQHVNPTTGEVVDVAELATGYLVAVAALDEAKHEFERLAQTVQQTRRELIDTLGENGAVDAGSGTKLVVVRGKGGRRTVNRPAAALYREQLVDLDLGAEVVEYKPPTLAELNQRKPEVIAAGIPWDQLVPEPEPGDLKLEVVH